MSKVFDYFNELENNGEEPCCASLMEEGSCSCGDNNPIEPTDEELAEIENWVEELGDPEDFFNN